MDLLVMSDQDLLVLKSFLRIPIVSPPECLCRFCVIHDEGVPCPGFQKVPAPAPCDDFGKLRLQILTQNFALGVGFLHPSRGSEFSRAQMTEELIWNSRIACLAVASHPLHQENNEK